MRQQRTDHLIWRVSGDSALDLLENTTTQHVEDLRPGEARPACLLDEHGRITAFLRIAHHADGTVTMDGSPAGAAGVQWLSRVAPLSQCEIDEAPDLMVVRTADPSVEDALLVDQRFDGLEGCDALMAVGDLQVDPQIDEEERIARGWPRFGFEITDTALLNDTPLLELAASFTKGCYRGQETVAKIRNLGHARRRMVRAHTDARAPWTAGIEITVADASVGTLNSAASDGEGMVGIATVKAEHAEALATIAGAPARLEPIVLAEAPPASPPPKRTLRLGLR